MVSWTVGSALLLGSIAVMASPRSAQAHTTRHAHVAATHAPHSAAGHSVAGHHGASHRPGGHVRTARAGHGYARYAGISCVPFARAESGIILTGNAATWWDEAEGRYARGNAPEAGSVLNFRANGSMHLGHVAVVKQVVNARQIEIDQANWWGPGGGHGVVSRSIAVVDVSPNNDWTAVRVGLGHSGSFGSVYPTYGFIYGRPDGSDPAPQLRMAAGEGSAVLNPAPRDLRPRGQRGRLATVHPVTEEEVAEAPADVQTGPLQLDAPDRNLR